MAEYHPPPLNGRVKSQAPAAKKKRIVITGGPGMFEAGAFGSGAAMTWVPRLDRKDMPE